MSGVQLLEPSEVDDGVRAGPGRVLDGLPSCVTVVTAAAAAGPAGSAGHPVTPVSLDPPLVAFFAPGASRAVAAVRESGRFAVNVLAADQAALYDRFTRGTGDRFDPADWELGGPPRLRRALAVLECELEAVTPAGGRVMVLGRVRRLGARRAEPLVSWRGALHGLAHTPPEHPHYRALPAC
ncbi:flavin reductase family protein [Amycolatopsis viridis]|uniref:Flavin reductase (DIM6/NTAB) family NADH-FMN oxidoreductase RutF n=1 Tax=Amycolatopsis viridis TaxID=185678 RepID=A0ABX0SRY6_9PSEU|nr:flavin reductase family protein [Amycolatopsis viridis]NIH79713.1 flavin reductase (DIM6/NTAB) family NADH-FMN oxidoreductase RutF [Amycolatopsis viridis]